MEVYDIKQLVYYGLLCHNKTVGHTFYGVSYGPDIHDRIPDNSTVILLSEPPTFHCVSVHVIKNGVSAEYFDPAGQPAITYGREIENFVNKFPDLNSNIIPFQDKYSNVCAGYSAMFVVLKSLGRSFDSILNELLQPVIPDMKMCLELATQPFLKHRKFTCGIENEDNLYRLTLNNPDQMEVTKTKFQTTTNRQQLNSKSNVTNSLPKFSSPVWPFIFLSILIIAIVMYITGLNALINLFPQLAILATEFAIIKAYTKRKATYGLAEFISTSGIDPT